MGDSRKSPQAGFPKTAKHLCMSCVLGGGGREGQKQDIILSPPSGSSPFDLGKTATGKRGRRRQGCWLAGFPSRPPPPPPHQLVPGPASSPEAGGSWLRNSGQVQAEPANPRFLLSWIPVPGEPPSFISVTPHTTSSVLIQWRVRPGKGRVVPEPASEAGTCLPLVPVSEGQWQVTGLRVVGMPTADPLSRAVGRSLSTAPWEGRQDGRAGTGHLG